MLLTLSLLPIYLFLVNGVTNADFGNNKRVPRRETQVTRTYTYNHPPLVETQDKIPVSIVYDDEEVVKISNKNEGGADIIIENEKNLLEHARDGKTINLEVSVNHPPSSGIYSYAGVKDNEEELISKPTSRSLKKPVPESEETKEESETRTRAKPRRRVQKVRRVKVNKSQLDTFIRDSEITKNKEEKETTATTVQSRTDKPSSRAPPTFKPRSGVRDPVVPIIDSESYVFSHSGAFHYSYEGGDGTKAYERGELKNFKGGSGSSVEGNYSYKDKEGNDVSLSYTADENGYRPVGAHLPTPPPIPIAIQRALAYLATKTTPEPITERIKTGKKKDLV